MAFLMSALMRAVLLNQYDGLCEKSGCPHESPVRPQSCTPKASSLDVHWRLNIFVTSLRTCYVFLSFAKGELETVALPRKAACKRK